MTIPGSLGIIQGRLLPRYKGRYQAFPAHYWQSEFSLAKAFGFSAIEWIVDEDTFVDNPITTAKGLESILPIIKETGIAVRSLCFDLAMQVPFHSENQVHTETRLKTILPLASQLGVRDIVIPCVDQSRLTSEKDELKFLKSLETLTPLAETHNISLNLEMDLAPKAFKAFLSRCSDSIKVNYDTGNSASLGYDPEEEFEAYGSRISNLHLKDRVLHGSSVFLGTGHTNFPKLFSLISQYSFDGIYTLQASRSEDYRHEHDHLLKQIAFISPFLTQKETS